MIKSYRLRTTPGKDNNIRININQDFDFLEILSLKLRQDDVYTRFCADYGVVVGRVITNGGFGVPNANISIFVPLSSEDEEDPVISTLYPYKTIETKNEDGYRYNLLPYRKEYDGHTPTGTFPDREDVLKRKEVLEIYDKYYKFTVKTNESGDFMIIGVPLGIQTIMMDLDLSNIGCFSLTPSDLIRMGIGSTGQFNGNKFKSSTDIDSLPQIVNQKKDINVSSFWGEDNICDVGITRVDFDLRDLGIEIKPHSVFMGSLISTSEEDFLKSNCKPKQNAGNLCDLTTAAGKILTIRQTIDYDSQGRPILESFDLPEGGNVINDDGTWLVEVPMNMDYITTDEFGNEVLSNDPTIGIPTKGKYRFRLQYQNEDGINNDILRADYLVPNIREYGWSSNGLFSSVDKDLQLKSYAFSLDWDDYPDQQVAINCEDYFYELNYNKVYTVANFIDRWKWGYSRSNHLGIKEITNRTCTTTNNRFPTNDGVRNFDVIFFLFNLIVSLISPILVALIPLIHIIAFLFPILKWLFIAFIGGLLGYFVGYYALQAVAGFPSFGAMAVDAAAALLFSTVLTGYGILIVKKWDAIKSFKFKGINLPMMSYPDCEACPCDSPDISMDEINGNLFKGDGNGGSNMIGDYMIHYRDNNSLLAPTNSVSTWSGFEPQKVDEDDYGSNKTTKLAADQFGVRYGFAGWQGINNYMGVPIIQNVVQDDFYLQKYVTLSQSLNLMNLRSRYFDGTAPNIIQTTINPQLGSQSFTDNVLIILCDQGIKDQLSSGTILTFNNVDNINDINLTGATIQNEFGSNSITGSTSISDIGISKTIKYLNSNGVESSSIVKITGDTLSSEYSFKTGVEYFQVITGITVNDSSGTSFINGNGNTSIISTHILNFRQELCYEPQGDSFLQYDINPIAAIGSAYKKYDIIILNRGVDVWSKPQTIKYDLSRIFGDASFTNRVSVEGQFLMNIPIQKNSGPGSGTWYNNYATPESHTSPYSTSPLYHPPFDFVVGDEFSSVTSTTIRFYSSLDKSTSSFKPSNSLSTLGYFTDGGWADSVSGINTIYWKYPSLRQGIVEGGSLIASDDVTCDKKDLISDISNTSVYAPAYHKTSPLLDVTISKGTFTHWGETITNAKLVLRSDRLPTSDKTQLIMNNNNSFALHQNDNFAAYVVAGVGGIKTINTAIGTTDSTNNAINMSGDTPSFTDNVLGSFSCEGMVPLKCYESYTENGNPAIRVIDNCSDNIDPVRVNGGCYKLINKPYVVSMGNDFTNFIEWKTRFRFLFGACRGVISHTFQNNWVNGVVYMFSFKKQLILNIKGQPKKYKFCGTEDSIYRSGQGPIYFASGTTNSFYYRSSPYDGTNFVGQVAQKASYSNPSYTNANLSFTGMNDRNLYFPTTIMDLGPRDQFLKEICFNPSFDGYLIDTIKSTTFNDTSDILQLAMISRLMNSSWLNGLLNSGDASINKLFSRTDDRLDGDISQMFSINSEYGVEPFSDDNYSDVDLYVNVNGGANMGIYYSSNTINRIMISPGITTFATNLYNYYGYPKSQEVPMYKWMNKDTSSIFGNDTNDWYTEAPYYSEKYQELNFVNYQSLSVPISEYFNNNTTGQKGYIYNSNTNGLPSPTFPQGSSDKFIVGAPYHFYFGLRKGKSSINRFITKYILNKDV